MRFRHMQSAVIIAGLLISTGGLPVQGADDSGQLHTTPYLHSSFEAADDAPLLIRELIQPRHPAPNYIPKKPGHYSIQDWKDAIDSTWGVGLPGTEKADLFMEWWQAVSDYSTSFHNIDTTLWDSIKTLYWPGTVDYDTISRGRFAAIMTYSTMVLRDWDTRALDLVVRNTQPAPGVPIFNVGELGSGDHFGAVLTPLPDSSLLVYETVPAHPLGLEPGDLVLGYDGIPWKDLYPQLLAAELPVAGYWASCDKAATHSILRAAGLNWHLFDTIDVVKYLTEDTLHLATSILDGQNMSLWATEQLPVPGVPKPDYYANEYLTWGVIDGTSIGYIYFLFIPNGGARSMWRIAVNDLVFNQQVTGLIVDFRDSYGGSIAGHPEFDILFADTIQSLRYYQRCSPCCKTVMCARTDYEQWFAINGDPATYFDKPIAVLMGPSCGGVGEKMPLALSLHPRAKVFGKPGVGLYTGYSAGALGYVTRPEWQLGIANVGGQLGSDTSMWMVHREFPNTTDYPWLDYEHVWLTRDGVAQGIDDVVETARAWVVSFDTDQDGVANATDNCPDHHNPGQEDNDFDGLGDACECFTLTLPLTGDVDTSGAITSADVIKLVNFVFKGGLAPDPCEASGDVNCDSAVTSADIIGLVNHVFKGDLPPCDACTLIDDDIWACP